MTLQTRRPLQKVTVDNNFIKSYHSFIFVNTDSRETYSLILKPWCLSQQSEEMFKL